MKKDTYSIGYYAVKVLEDDPYMIAHCGGETDWTFCECDLVHRTEYFHEIGHKIEMVEECKINPYLTPEKEYNTSNEDYFLEEYLNLKERAKVLGLCLEYKIERPNKFILRGVNDIIVYQTHKMNAIEPFLKGVKLDKGCLNLPKPEGVPQPENEIHIAYDTRSDAWYFIPETMNESHNRMVASCASEVIKEKLKDYLTDKFFTHPPIFENYVMKIYMVQKESK